jgi:hypothetical protein
VLWSRWSESSSELDTEGLGCVLRDLVELESLVSVTDFSRPAVLPPSFDRAKEENKRGWVRIGELWLESVCGPSFNHA